PPPSSTLFPYTTLFRSLDHWLEIGDAADASKLPKIFFVNWFRKSPEGRFLWPGYGENSRVIAWICERITGTADATETAIGLVPRSEEHTSELQSRSDLV